MNRKKEWDWMDQVAQKALNEYANQKVLKELQSLQRQQALMTTVKAIKFSISYRIKQLKQK
tara:strand:+ start:200 stop:382 length:183 start_codon:yes stop_codon:yes gene_type:complete